MKIKVCGGDVKTIKSVMKDELNYPNLRELMTVLGYEVGYDAGSKVLTLSKK